MDRSLPSARTSYPVIWNFCSVPKWLWNHLHQHQCHLGSHELAVHHPHQFWRTAPGIYQHVQAECRLSQVRWVERCCHPDLLLFSRSPHLDHAPNPSHGYHTHHSRHLVRECCPLLSSEGDSSKDCPHALRKWSSTTPNQPKLLPIELSPPLWFRCHGHRCFEPLPNRTKLLPSRSTLFHLQKTKLLHQKPPLKQDGHPPGNHPSLPSQKPRASTIHLNDGGGRLDEICERFGGKRKETHWVTMPLANHGRCWWNQGAVFENRKMQWCPLPPSTLPL